MLPLRGYISAIAAALLFGFGNVSVRAATRAGVDPILGAAITYIIAAVMLAPFLPRVRLTRRDTGLAAGMVIAGGVVAPLTLFFAFSHTTAVEGSLLLNAEVVMTSLLAFIFLRERLHVREWFAFLIIFIGVLAVTLPPLFGAGGFDPAHMVGNLLIFVAAFGWACDNNFSTPLAKRNDLRALVALKGLGGAVVLSAVVLLAGVPLHAPVAAFPPLIFAGLFGFGAASLLFYDALRRIGASRTAILFTLGTFAGVAGGYLVLGESVTWPHLLGGIAMLGGALVLTKGAAAESPHPET